MNTAYIATWARGLSIPLMVLVVFSMLMTSSTVTPDVMAASGLVTDFAGAGEDIQRCKYYVQLTPGKRREGLEHCSQPP